MEAREEEVSEGVDWVEEVYRGIPGVQAAEDWVAVGLAAVASAAAARAWVGR